MNKQNFEFELKEFNRIKKGLEEGEEWEFVKMLENNIYELLYYDPEFKKYEEMFKEVLLAIDKYFEDEVKDNTNTRAAKENIIATLLPIIEALKADINAEEMEQEKKDDDKVTSSEIKVLLSNIINKIKEEAKSSWENAGKYIKTQELPECSKMISEFKKTSKETEKKIKAQIQNWLKDDHK